MCRREGFHRCSRRVGDRVGLLCEREISLYVQGMGGQKWGCFPSCLEESEGMVKKRGDLYHIVREHVARLYSKLKTFLN